MKLTLLFILFFSSIAFSKTTEEIIDENAFNREWLVLLHYKKALIGYKSEVDAESFFYDKEGKTDPKKEMIASLKKMSLEDMPGDLNHPQCVFPARFKYLKDLFNLQVKPVECSEYKWWRENLPFKSLTIIFASYYANNPASMFGHTLLRINSSDKSSISDYGVDFSAIADTDHGIEFAIRGLMGGYMGLFSIKPYYMKLNEYIENENRDLWEYDLNLTSGQIDKMLSHLWELMRFGQFDYFFLTENCSYQLLTLLEVANPELKLSDEFVWKTMPIDTIKAITKANIVTDVRYRPAYKKTVLQRQMLLNKNEKKELKEVTSFNKDPEGVDSAKVLEAAIALLRYERFEEKKFTSEQSKLLKGLLAQRASVGGKVEYPDLKETFPIEKLRPDTSHDSEKYTIGIGNNSALKGAYTEIGLKAALHDLLDIDDGYPKHALIDVANLKLRYSGENKNIFFQELKYAEAFSLFPLDEYEFKWSWRAGGRSYRVYDSSCDNCVAHQLKSGGGISVNLAFIDMDVYSLLLLNAEVSKDFYRGYRIAPALNLGGVWTVRNNLKAHYEFELNKDLNAPTYYRDVRVSHLLGIGLNINLQQEVRINAQSWQSIKGVRPTEEIQLSYSFYY